eukprot:scaffold22423_cov120-Isochrysis_galbana.AAC.5
MSVVSTSSRSSSAPLSLSAPAASRQSDPPGSPLPAAAPSPSILARYRASAAAASAAPSAWRKCRWLAQSPSTPMEIMSSGRSEGVRPSAAFAPPAACCSPLPLAWRTEAGAYVYEPSGCSTYKGVSAGSTQRRARQPAGVRRQSPPQQKTSSDRWYACGSSGRGQ